MNRELFERRSIRQVLLLIARCALARRESRGAHFREDFPETGDLATSAFSRVRMEGSEFRLSWQPVEFTRVRPGQSLIVP